MRCECPPYVAVIATLCLAYAGSANATLVGLTVDGGPGFTAVQPAPPLSPTQYLPLVLRTGMWIEDPDYFLDVDMSLLVGAAIDILDSGDPGGVQSAMFPTAFDPRSQLQVARLFRFVGGAVGFDVGVPGLAVGLGTDVDIGAQQVKIDTAAAGEGQVGNVYIGIGLGPTVNFRPSAVPQLRVYSTTAVSVLLGNHSGFYAGLGVTTSATALYAVLPRYVDVRATLSAELRNHEDGIYRDAVGGTFTPSSASCCTSAGSSASTTTRRSGSSRPTLRRRRRRPPRSFEAARQAKKNSSTEPTITKAAITIATTTGVMRRCSPAGLF
jgi:hypothetical protein